MAVVIIGELVIFAVLNLFFMPAFYQLFGRSDRYNRSKKQAI